MYVLLPAQCLKPYWEKCEDHQYFHTPQSFYVEAGMRRFPLCMESGTYTECMHFKELNWITTELTRFVTSQWHGIEPHLVTSGWNRICILGTYGGIHLLPGHFIMDLVIYVAFLALKHSEDLYFLAHGPAIQLG